MHCIYNYWRNSMWSCSRFVCSRLLSYSHTNVCVCVPGQGSGFSVGNFIEATTYIVVMSSFCVFVLCVCVSVCLCLCVSVC